MFEQSDIHIVVEDDGTQWGHFTNKDCAEDYVWWLRENRKIETHVDSYGILTSLRHAVESLLQDEADDAKYKELEASQVKE